MPCSKQTMTWKLSEPSDLKKDIIQNMQMSCQANHHIIKFTLGNGNTPCYSQPDYDAGRLDGRSPS
eukprot:8883872-Karenia_brevis.AAC.1